MNFDLGLRERRKPGLNGLSAVIRRATTLGSGAVIDREDLVFDPRPVVKPKKEDANRWTMEEFERRGQISRRGKTRQQYFVLQLGLEHAGEVVTWEEVRDFLCSEAVPEDIRWTSQEAAQDGVRQRVSSLLSRLRQKVNALGARSGWSFGGPDMIVSPCAPGE